MPLSTIAKFWKILKVIIQLLPMMSSLIGTIVFHRTGGLPFLMQFFSIWVGQRVAVKLLLLAKHEKYIAFPIAVSK